MATTTQEAAAAAPPQGRHWYRLLVAGTIGRLGPGLITGAADDDPSGIATYSQAGAQFGLNMLWTVCFTYPLMVAVQVICARVGRVSGRGLAANLTEVFPRWMVGLLVFGLMVANTVNIGADVGAMGAAATLVTGARDDTWFTIGAALLSLVLQVLVPYRFYVKLLKWLTLVLFAYVGVVFTVAIDWHQVVLSTLMPSFKWTPEAATMVVAVFGTTISPYLFFWQSAEEVEEMQLKNRVALRDASEVTARREIRRMTQDTFAGMGISNLIAFFIILTTAVTLHQSGMTDIQTSAQAAEALKPIAGPLAFWLFSIGIVGTGLLAMPVLAGSAGYALCEVLGRPAGLEKSMGEAKTFYGIIATLMIVALAVPLSTLDPIKALFWSAVLNGVIAVPIMAATMWISGRHRQMGDYVANRWQRWLGWTATAVMAAAALGMFVLG
ncbi:MULTISPECIES: NRAMP family divalent metal transporter [Sphingomonas]|uniref:NRAMP family divalent metal transporter n=1 Tax=Sphingomonas TaxID=13687 RepID=UPI000DEFBC51|nr:MULTISPECIES: divalent metal cation transporter [Sphingomonas]